MAVFNEPQKWAQTLGKYADVTAIPDTAGDTEPSIAKIFPSVFSIPLARGGRAIPRSVLNGLFKLLGDWIFFNQNGGVPTYSKSFDYVAGRVVSYKDNIYKCIQANGVSSTVVAPDSGTGYWQRLDGAIGEIKWFAFNTAPDGFLVCNGAKVSRETYADLFAVIGTTFGSGDGSTTFALPNLIDKFAQGSTTVGTYKSAGLPNITGGSIDAFYVDSGGFISNAGNVIGKFSDANTYPTSRATFNASKSNSIYGNSTTVQPPALTLLPCIKY